MAETAQELLVKVGADVDQAISGLNRVDKTTGKLGSNVSRAMKVAGLGFIGGAAMAIRAAGNYQESMNTLQAVTGANAAVMKQAGAAAKQLGADTKLPGTSASDAAEAMTELAKGGMTVKQAMSAVRGTLLLSAAAQIGNAEAANITSKALNAFGMAASKSNVVADQLAATANASSAEITDVAQAMQAAATVFSMGKQPIDALTTSIGLMANKGISGSDAGTSLKTMLMSLMAPTAKSAKALAKMGVSVRDAGGHMRPMRGIIQQFSRATAGMSDAQRDAAFATIFGSDAVRAANVVLGSGVGAYDKMHNAVTKTGAAQQVADAKTKGFNGALEAFKSTLETLSVTLGTILLPAATKVMRALTSMLGVVEPLIGFVSANSEIFKVLAVTLATLGAELYLVTKATAAFRAAMAALNIVMAMNPFVLIVAALVALGAGLVLAYKNSEKFRNIVNGVFSSVRNFVVPIAQQIASFVVRAWETIRSVTEQVWGRIGSTVQKVWQLIRTYVQTGLAVIKGIISTVMAAVHGDWSKAWSTLKSTAVTLVKGMLSVVGQTIMLLGPLLWKGVIAAVKGIAMLAMWAAGEALKLGKGIADGIVAGIAGLAGRLAGALTGAVGSAIGKVKGAFGIKSPSHVTKYDIGKPLADGVILGWLEGIRDLPTNMTDRLRNALDKAKAVVDSRREALVAAFDRVSEDAMRAFDANTDRMLSRLDAKLDTALAKVEAKRSKLTASEKALANMDAADKTASLQKGLDDADAAVANAKTPEEAAAAEQQRQDAIRAVERDELEKKAALEREAADKRAIEEAGRQTKRIEKQKLDMAEERFQRRRNLEQMTADLRAEIGKHPLAWKKNHQIVMKLLDSFKQDFAVSGAVMGKMFAKGIEAAIGQVKESAKKLADAAKGPLQLNSPAKEGPMSDLDKWWKPLGDTLLSGVDENALRSGLAAMVDVRPPAASFGAGARRRGSTLTAGGGSEPGGDLVLEVDGQVLGRIARRQLQLTQKRTGVNPVITSVLQGG